MATDQRKLGRGFRRELQDGLRAVPAHHARRIKPPASQDVWHGQNLHLLVDLALTLQVARFRDQAHPLEHATPTARASIMRYLEIGETVPPYFVWRIAVLLRKGKEITRELRFRQAWCRHQSAYVALGTREKKISERLRKLELRQTGI
ncbi:MAG: hypothetical protein F4Z95_11205 [Gammaproteobacteria bacterium]|nr:hypothetical protein [Gammaproteobacteria bacterium]